MNESTNEILLDIMSGCRTELVEIILKNSFPYSRWEILSTHQVYPKYSEEYALYPFSSVCLKRLSFQDLSF